MKTNKRTSIKSKLGLAAALGSLLVGTQAFGLTITQTQTFSGEVPPFGSAFTFNHLDSTLYSLADIQSITITYSLTKTGGKGQADNDSANSGDVDFTQSVSGSISSGDVSLVDGVFQTNWTAFDANSSSGNIFLTATTGDNTSSFNNTGLDDYTEWSPDSVSDGNTPSGTAINSAVYNNYLGTTTFDIDLSAIQSTSTSGLGGVQTAQVVSNLSGFIEVEYIVVPEVGTLAMAAIALGSFGGIALLRRRKRA